MVLVHIPPGGEAFLWLDGSYGECMAALFAMPALGTWWSVGGNGRRN